VNPPPPPLLRLDEVVTVLLAQARETARVSLRKILHGPNWDLREVSTCREAIAVLRRRNHPLVVICDNELPDSGWIPLLDAVNELHSRPSLIISSRLADERMWAEVLNLGAYDLLAVPFAADEVTRTVFLAWQHAQRGSRNGVIPQKRGADLEPPAQSTEKAKEITADVLTGTA
jgi:DNA-binding NtrC family response regulator